MIRSVRLVITPENLDDFSETYYNEGLDLLDNILNFQRYCFAIQQRHLASWNLSLVVLSDLKLNHLVLDLSEAYSLDGRFNGLRLARLASRFEHGIPARLEIVAPSSTIAKGIRRVFENLNS